MEKTCENCEYYLRHYIWCNGLFSIYCGHCIKGKRPINRKPDRPACGFWEEQTDKYKKRHYPKCEVNTF